VGQTVPWDGAQPCRKLRKRETIQRRCGETEIKIRIRTANGRGRAGKVRVRLG
jgi:hypothetical protein